MLLFEFTRIAGDLATDLDTEHGQTRANTCDVARQVGRRNAADLHL